MKKFKCRYLLSKTKPVLSFISVYYTDYELAVLASARFGKMLKIPIYIYEEQYDDGIYFYVTSNVKSGNDYICITTP